MNTIKKVLLLGIIGMFYSIQVFSQAPEGFNYQAVARDNGNLVVSKPITVKVFIEKSQIGGTVVYNETHSLNTNAQGIFTMVVGKGSPVLGTFSTLKWDKDTLFMRTTINFGTGDIAFPSTQLVSVPYALFAKNGTQWVNNGSSISFINGFVGIGTNLPSATLHVDSIFGISSGGQAWSMKVGKTGELGFYPNTTAGSGTPLLWLEDSPELLGIGTAKPLEKVDVVGGGVRIDQTIATPKEKTVYGNSMPFAYGYISGSTIITDYGINSVTNPTTGNYVVTLDNSYSGSPVVMATSFSTSPNDEVVTYDFTGNNIINIHVSDGTGTAVSSNFSIVVFANP